MGKGKNGATDAMLIYRTPRKNIAKQRKRQTSLRKRAAGSVQKHALQKRADSSARSGKRQRKLNRRMRALAQPSKAQEREKPPKPGGGNVDSIGDVQMQ
jgi:hypothetical protein